MKRQIFDLLRLLVIAPLLIIGVGFVKAWTGPTATAPGGNVSSPLNVGSAVQTKLGSLIINAQLPIQNAIGLTVFGTSTFMGKVQINSGSPQYGQVLMAVDGNGTGSWIATSSLGITGGTVSSTGSIGGGCFATSMEMGADYVTGRAVYSSWGNASTTYTSTASPANTDQDATACTCAAGYTPRISGQVIGGGQTGGNGKYITGSGSFRPAFASAFLCVKN